MVTPIERIGRISERGLESDRALDLPLNIVRDPFPVDPASRGLGPETTGVAEMIRLGEESSALAPLDGTNPMPGVLAPMNTSALAPAEVSEAPARGFWGRLWDGVTGLFGARRSVDASEEGGRLFSGGGDDATVDPAGARRSIALENTADPFMSLNDPNPLTRVRIKLETDMPGNESVNSFVGRLVSLTPEASRGEARSILSILTEPSAVPDPLVASLRSEVAAEVRGSGQGYQSRYQLADAVRVVLARHGLDLGAIEGRLAPDDVQGLSAIEQNLSLQLLPDDVPVYRTSGRGVREGATTTVMRANMDGMTYWGVGADGIATAEAYLSEGRALVTTTVGDLRRQGVLTTDDIAKAGNAVEFYHQPNESGGWLRVPVSVIWRTPR